MRSFLSFTSPVDGEEAQAKVSKTAPPQTI